MRSSLRSQIVVIATSGRIAAAACLLCAVARAEGEPPPGAGWRLDQQLCGVNSTYVMLKLNGRPVTYDELKASLPVGADGTSLRAMRDALTAWGQPARVVRGNVGQLPSIRFPVIAHLERDEPAEFAVSRRGHYVVLLGLDAIDGVRFIDGTSGRMQTQPVATFFRQWSGYLIEPDEPRWQIGPMLMTALCGVIAAWSWWRYARRAATRAAPGLAVVTDQQGGISGNRIP